jgi:Tol biopolymer transport system component
MQILGTLLVAFLATSIALPEEGPASPSGTESRELVVSHTDEKGILQLYRMKEDGSDRQQLSRSKRGCRMPACSPDGTKLIYVQQVGDSLVALDFRS